MNDKGSAVEMRHSTRRLACVGAVALASILLSGYVGAPGAFASRPYSREQPPRAEAAGASGLVVSWGLDQIQPAVAYDSHLGQHLVVWEDHHWGADWDIYARVVLEDGSTPGLQFGLSADDPKAQLAPDVAYNAVRGEYLVAWEHAHSATDHDVYARRVGGDGSLLSGRLAVATLTNYESNPALAFNPTRNEYLIVWEHNFEGLRHGIYAQRLAADGTRLGSAILIDASSLVPLSTTPYDALAPAVACDPDRGQYLVVWQDRSGTADYDIIGQRVGGDGALAGSEIAISTWEYDQVKPRLAYNPVAGDFLVVWEDHHWGWGDDWDIYGQRVRANGALSGGNLGICWEGSAHRESPDVAYLRSADEYLVAWEREDSALDHDVFGRRLTGNGTLVGDETSLSTLGSNEAHPALSAAGDWSYFAVWEDGRNAATQGVDIFGQRVHVHRLSGRVYEGNVGDESRPLGGVTVELFCSNNADTQGTRVASVVTNQDGWYGLVPTDVCEYYNLIESDPLGYVSVDARSVDGTVKTANWIQYTHALVGKTLTGNKFWDRRPATPTPTATRTSTATHTRTPPPTRTATQSPTPSATHTRTQTATVTETSTPSPTRSATGTLVPTESATPSTTPTATDLPTPTQSPTEPSPPGALPDLLVTDIWGAEGRVCFQLMNVGEAPAAPGHQVGLTVDSAFVASDPVAVSVSPRERWSSCLQYAWDCTGRDDLVTLEADCFDDLLEEDETDNRRQETWICDDEPAHLVAGPEVLDLTPNSATIWWETDEPGDSTVDFGREASVYPRESGSAALVTEHSVTLTRLESAAAYHFRVRSADDSGNLLETRDRLFTTLPMPDTVHPTLSLGEPLWLDGCQVYTATAADNVAVDRVEFYLDGMRVFCDYTPPYPYYMDPWQHTVGDHLLTARAVDAAGLDGTDHATASVAHPTDSRVPLVTILSPTEEMTVSGKITVTAVLSDDMGLRDVRFYVDGEKRGARDFGQGIVTATVHFHWDSTTVPNAEYRLGIEAFDYEDRNNYDTVDVDIYNPPPPPQPKLEVTEHKVTRSQNHFAVELKVENKGIGKAYQVQVQDTLVGFQPIEQTVGTKQYQASYSPANSSWSCQVTDKQAMSPGEIRTYRYDVVPVLVYPNPPQPGIGSLLRLLYKGPDGTSHYDQVPLSVSHVVEGASKVPIATSLKNALKQANYLIVTHPGLLYMQYWMNEVDELLSSMAHLAKLKRGALGFLTKYDASTLRNLIKPGGAWASKLHSQFSSVTLGGYVLIVGESEVVPAYGVSLGTSLIHASDHPYSDVVGDDNRPDLVVARIVGDSAAKLAKPLQTSVSITEGKAGFGFDRSHALSVGGGGGGVNTWTQDAIGAANLLDDEYSVTTLLCTHYFELSSFQSSFASGARLTVGDVTGDAKAEIVVGDPHADQIHVYDGGGTKVKSFDCGYGAKQFEAGDRLAVANHVIYMADVSADQVLKYNWAGVLQSHFNVSLEAADGLAAGDVAGDGYEDIVVADASADKIRVFTHNWVKQSEFSRSYDVSHELAVGNALGLSKAQIVIASGSSGKVEVWTSAGSKETSFNAFFSSNDLLAVGDTFGKGRADVLRYDDAFGRVHIYRYGVPENKTVGSFVWDRYFDTWCTGSVGLAAGGVEGNNKDQIVVGIPTSGKVHIYESGCGDRLTTPFESKAKEQDLVFFSDHGSSTTWGSALRMSDFPVAFGGANPLLFGAACSTADYEGFDDNTISEGFFDSGAAAYIGATVNSDAGLDTPAKDVFFKNWVNQSTSVGRAFAATERDFQQKYKDDYWVLEYNLYGDPKLGLTAGALSSQDASTGRGQPPPPLLDLAVPDYEVTRVAGWDHVHIPSGGTMLEEGKPLVPIYSVQLDFPKGHQVQDVLLLELGDWATTTGLHIPNREVVIKRGVTEDSHLAQAESAAAGWYPDRQYDWSVLQNLGGSTAVQITVYPFDYNPLTTDARLRKRYRFEIVYVGTDVEIIGLETDRDAYEPGETVVVDVALHAGEMPGDALIRLTVKRQGSQELVGGLLLRTLRDLQGEATYSAQWDASGEEPGGYFVEATVHAADGTVLAERTAPFQLGIAAGEVARFEASPAVFQVGDDVSLFLAFSNVGTQAIVSGTARIGVYDALGAAVQRFDHKFTGLAAGQSVQVDRTWDTAGAAPGSYRIRAYVLFDSQATEPMTAVVRSGRFVALPIVRKAYW